VSSGFLVSVESAASAAAKLTPAQQRAVLAGRIGDGAGRGRGYWPLWNALNSKRLFTRANGCDVLTDFGRAVQRELIEQERERAR
jgi:hypothetical protein